MRQGQDRLRDRKGKVTMVKRLMRQVKIGSGIAKACACAADSLHALLLIGSDNYGN